MTNALGFQGSETENNNKNNPDQNKTCSESKVRKANETFKVKVAPRRERPSLAFYSTGPQAFASFFVMSIFYNKHYCYYYYCYYLFDIKTHTKYIHKLNKSQGHMRN